MTEKGTKAFPFKTIEDLIRFLKDTDAKVVEYTAGDMVGLQIDGKLYYTDINISTFTYRMIIEGWDKFYYIVTYKFTTAIFTKPKENTPSE